MARESPVTRVQVQLSLPSALPASCNWCLCPFSCCTCPGSYTILQQPVPWAGATQELPPLLAETQGAEESLPAEECWQEPAGCWVLGAGASSPPLATTQAGAALSACQYLSPNEIPGSESSEGDDPRLLVSLPVFNEEIAVSPSGAHSP